PVNRDLRRQHLLEHADCDARLEGEPRDPAVAGVRLAVVLANGAAQRVVARRAPAGFDVLVLVESRDALRGQLAAEPVGLLEQYHAAAVPRRRQGRGDTASAAADDQDLAGFSAR